MVLKSRGKKKKGGDKEFFGGIIAMRNTSGKS
jgi:hypothetical protein